MKIKKTVFSLLAMGLIAGTVLTGCGSQGGDTLSSMASSGVSSTASSQASSAVSSAVSSTGSGSLSSVLNNSEFIKMKDQTIDTMEDAMESAGIDIDIDILEENGNLLYLLEVDMDDMDASTKQSFVKGFSDNMVQDSSRKQFGQIAKQVNDYAGTSDVKVIVRLTDDNGTVLAEETYSVADADISTASSSTSSASSVTSSASSSTYSSAASGNTIQSILDSSDFKSQIAQLNESYEAQGIKLECSASADTLYYDCIYQMSLDSSTRSTMQDTLEDMLDNDSYTEVFDNLVYLLETQTNVNDPKVVVRYLDKDGNMICSKQFD